MSEGELASNTGKSGTEAKGAPHLILQIRNLLVQFRHVWALGLGDVRLVARLLELQVQQPDLVLARGQLHRARCEDVVLGRKEKCEWLGSQGIWV